MLDLSIVSVMIALGIHLGFIGFGGAGLITGLLILLFHVPVHLAFGTGLGAMFATAVVGGWSHLREGNVERTMAVQIGLAGILGAYLGGGLALATGAVQLKNLAGMALIFNGSLIFVRTYLARRKKPPEPVTDWRRELPRNSILGSICGLASGYFAIGVAPWIQLGLMVLKGLELRRIIGTTMVASALMSLSGAARFAQGGQIEPFLLASTILGLSIGSFLGAKLTKRTPGWLVRAAISATPFTAGTLLLLIPATG